MLDLSTSVTSLFMIGPVYGTRLQKLGIFTVEDLLYHLPFRYEDYSQMTKINMLTPEKKLSVAGVISEMKNIYTRHGKKIQQGKLTDETGSINIIWYNQPYLSNILKPGTKVVLAGKAEVSGHRMIFQSPEYEILYKNGNTIHTGRLVPVYPETYGVSSKWLRSRISNILTKFDPDIRELLPREIISEYGLISLKDAIYNIHFPQNYESIETARARLSFDELFVLELAATIRKKSWQKKKTGKKFPIKKNKEKIESFIAGLPFRLTNAQKRASREVLADLQGSIPMNRLLEGDVGSGKTVVATIAIFASYLSGYQSVLMAPTEILSEQHFKTIKELLSGYKINIGLRTKLKKLEDADYDIIIGTHALLNEKKHFRNLGLIVIDEQQRFGVEQRATLRSKANNPHLLTMTATPIPRTIALTLYSDLNLSVIDEMPLGRMPVKTWIVPSYKRLNAYQWIKKQIVDSDLRNQVFIICPFIEESESLTTVKAAKTEFDKLQKEIFPDLKLGLLHGRLKDKEKNSILSDFKNGKLNILVSTPVVEVGIDIPNATIMMIEGGDRFGLSQLHQLRGRVGRNNLKSYCLIFAENDSEKTITRLKFLETEYIGPKLAELDLKLRGPGDIYGTRQHGGFGLKIADITDLKIVEASKNAVNGFKFDEETLSSFPLLRQRVQKYTIQNISQD